MSIWNCTDNNQLSEKESEMVVTGLGLIAIAANFFAAGFCGMIALVKIGDDEAWQAALETFLSTLNLAFGIWGIIRYWPN
jgi:hypothetical protein